MIIDNASWLAQCISIKTHINLIALDSAGSENVMLAVMSPTVRGAVSNYRCLGATVVIRPSLSLSVSGAVDYG